MIMAFISNTVAKNDETNNRNKGNRCHISEILRIKLFRRQTDIF